MLKTWIDIDVILENLWEKEILTLDEYLKNNARNESSKEAIEAYIYKYCVDVMIVFHGIMVFNGNFVHSTIILRCYICKKSCHQREKMLFQYLTGMSTRKGTWRTCCKIALR